MEYVIFDRSIFHGDKFNQIQRSGLMGLVRQNKVRIYYTPTFIEESLQFMMVDIATFRDQIQFLLQINFTHWFRPAENITDAELGVRYIHPYYHLLLDEEIMKIRLGIAEFCDEKIDEKELNATLIQVAKNRNIRRDFRRQRLALRDKVPAGDYNFDLHFENNVEWFLENGVMKFNDAPDGFMERWKGARQMCPFTEQYLKCWITTSYLPATNKSMPVDENDLADATQLAYLIWADTMVSDDTHFMKEAFNLVYPNHCKKLLTLPRFLAHLNELERGNF
jgi:hypothetical protein